MTKEEILSAAKKELEDKRDSVCVIEVKLLLEQIQYHKNEMLIKEEKINSLLSEFK